MKVIPQFMHAEFNVVHLGLIPVQSKLPASARSGWTSTHTEGTNTAGISSVSTAPAGVPHGLAGDVFAALITEAVAARQGTTAPELAALRLTVADIARQASLHSTGDVYRLVQGAIESLQMTNFVIWQRWTTPLLKRSERVSMSLINEFSESVEENIHFPEQQRVIYTLKLPSAVLGSVDGALVLATDRTIMQQLTSPTARGIYRLLESWRRDPADLRRVESRVVISAVDFIASARLFGSRTQVSQLLQPLLRPGGAFEQLQAANYLHTVSTIGRGDATQLAFTFVRDGSTTNMAALRLLQEQGITGQNAETLASLHLTEEVECAIWLVEEKLQKDASIRNPPGLIIKMLKDGSASSQLRRFRTRPRSIARPASPTRALPQAEPAPETPAEQQNAALQSITSLVALRKMNAEHAQLLRDRLFTGRVSPQDIRNLLTLPSQIFQDQLRLLLQPDVDLT